MRDRISRTPATSSRIILDTIPDGTSTAGPATRKAAIYATGLRSATSNAPEPSPTTSADVLSPATPATIVLLLARVLRTGDHIGGER